MLTFTLSLAHFPPPFHEWASSGVSPVHSAFPVASPGASLRDFLHLLSSVDTSCSRHFALSVTGSLKVSSQATKDSVWTYLHQKYKIEGPRCLYSSRHLPWGYTSYIWGYTSYTRGYTSTATAAAAAKSLQLCPTLCDPIDGSPPGSAVPGILQAITLEWVAISFSNAWKGKVKVKLLSRVRLFATPWAAAYQAPESMGFSRQEYWSGMPLPSPVLSYRH